MTITVWARLRARPGRRAEFVSLAAALSDAAAAEPGTLRYDWYAADDPDTFVVIEEYTDPAAAVAHNQACGHLLGRMPELAEMAAVHLHGELGPDLAGWVAGNPAAHAHPPLPFGGRTRPS